MHQHSLVYRWFSYSRSMKQVLDVVNEINLKLLEWTEALSSSFPKSQQCGSFKDLGISLSEATWILSHLRELFNISDNKEKKRLMTMLPPDWGRERIADWFDGSDHHARLSIELRTTKGVLSMPDDHRGNKPIDSQIEIAVHHFYVSDEVSRETPYKKQVVHVSPARDPVPLRFLHLSIGETYAQFKSKYPHIEINRSKFYALRPSWVRQQTFHETCMCIYHENADLTLKVRNGFEVRNRPIF